MSNDPGTAPRAPIAATVAGLCFFVLAAQFMTAIMAGAAMAPGYDLQGAAISDLGTIPETAWLFNSSLLLTGVLNIVGGYLLCRHAGGLWQLAIFGLAGLGAIGAGLFPLGASGLHGLFALVAFVFFNVQTLVTAWHRTGAMRIVGMLLGLIGLGYVVVMAIGDAGNASVFGPIGHGGAERMIVYPPMFWLLALGGALMASPGRA